MPDRTTTEVEALRARLEVAEETLAAIRTGAVDALVVEGREGRHVYTLDGADQVYRALVERIEEGAGALTTSGVVLFCNEALARLLGRPLRSVTGHSLRDFLAAESRDRLAALIAEATAGRPARGELVLESPTAGAVPVAIALTSFPAFGETSLAGIVSDLREQKRREAEINRLADQLRVLAAELSFAEVRERKRLAKVLHDHVQQLLVAARMQVELARRTDDSSRHALLLGEAESILQEATAASRSLASELSPPVLHEAGLAGGLTWLAARFEEQHQFAVHVQAETNAEPAREEIRGLVFECVRELLFNAVKHSGEREGWVTLTKGPDGTLEVVVRDQGKGFAPDAVRDRPVNQLTFGLFSIEQRLAYIGGQMTVDAAPGRGTTVRLSAPRGRAPSLPVSVPATPKRPTGIGEPGAGTARERSIRVILADDHQVVRQGLAALLRLEPGLDVVAEVADGAGVIDAVARLAPDVVLMDVNLGEMSGIEATRVVTAHHPRVKVIGLSMHVDPEVARVMLAAGAVAFLAKSGNVQDVVDAIRAAARPKRRQRKQHTKR